MSSSVSGASGSAASFEYCQRALEPRVMAAAPSYFQGAAVQCDICRSALETGAYFADAELPGLEQWCYFCQECLTRHQVRFGQGRGHLYQKSAGSPVRWQRVAGDPD